MKKVPIVMFLFLVLAPGVRAATPAEVGQTIANYAKYVQKNKAQDFHYHGPNVPGSTAFRSKAYDGRKAYSHTFHGKRMKLYATDCNGFVGFVVHYATKLGPPSGDENIMSFTIAGTTLKGWKIREKWNPYFSVVKSDIRKSAGLIELYKKGELLPGDLIASIGDGNTHIQIYAGEGMIVDNSSPYPGALHLRVLSEIKHGNGRFTVFRITDRGAREADLSKIVYPNGDGTVTDITALVVPSASGNK